MNLAADTSLTLLTFTTFTPQASRISGVQAMALQRGRSEGQGTGEGGRAGGGRAERARGRAGGSE